MKKIAIIGSGLAGLATAVRLRNLGLEVEVFEANNYPGGKLHEFRSDGFRFDAGPSVCTMPELVDELIESVGKNPRDYFNYIKKDIVCNYFFPNGKNITGYFDHQKFASEVDEKLGSGGDEVLAYLKDSSRSHNLAGNIFLNKPINRLSTFTNTKTVKAIANLPTLGIFNTLNENNKKRLSHSELIRIFNRYATYNGSDPYRAPGILKTVAHLEYGMGTYFIKGGFYNMTKSLYDIGCEMGVKYHFNSRVEKINYKNNQVNGIKSEGEDFGFDAVVSNMDVIPTYKYLLNGELPYKKLEKQERSTSMVVFYWGVKGVYPELDLHNAFFSSDYQSEFEDLFKNFTISDDPTIYLNISCKDEPDDAPEGHENWFAMVNAPAIKGQNWEEIVKRTRKNMLRKISKTLNTDVESKIVFEKSLDPLQIQNNTSSYQGSIYGASSNDKFSAFLRQPNESGKLKGLYFAGGSAHPGGGTPLCILSSKITADLISEKL